MSIDCAYDPSSQRYRVTRVGPQSTIAKLWGLNPVSYPCLIGHSYDEAVSRAYPQVTRSGEPHYDHIYAAMASARGDVVWVPYQRVVLPLAQGRRARGVARGGRGGDGGSAHGRRRGCGGTWGGDRSGARVSTKLSCE